MSLFDTLQRSGALRPVDLALAHSLQRLDPDADDAALAAAALASYAVAQGHAAFDPAAVADLVQSSIVWPGLDEWQASLARCSWVWQAHDDTTSDESAPLVVEGGRIYLRRYREYECRLAAAMRRLCMAPVAPPAEAVDALHARLFPKHANGDAQARAAREALRHPVLLVTGGPGTGKTTTIARVLLLLVAQAQADGQPAPRIALAAPTGRAADRMAGSVRRVADALRADGVEPALCDALPTGASTLHRLLGLLPGHAHASADARHPLPLDVLVVDEASMVDLALMCKLVEALPTGCRLLLLGDSDQLPSIEAGDVLAALSDAADAMPGNGAPLAGCRVHLDRGYRQNEGLVLDPVTDAVRRGDAIAALASLRAGTPGVQWHEDVLDPLAGALRTHLLARWSALLACREPMAALGLAHQARLLTALRDGPQGASQLNARIELALAGPQREPYFHGRLLMVTENSPRHGLFNGDVGVCLREHGTSVTWFNSADGPRPFHPAALPAHVSAFAMTVHKAQGSEFDCVWLQLPAVETRVLSRELLYTALTRARNELHVLGPAASVENAIARQVRRTSGLAARLGPERIR